jgi:nitroreductase
VDALNLQDWRDREVLHRTFSDLPDEARKVYLAACPVQRTMMLRAPELLVVVYRTKRRERSPRSPADLNAHAAIWMAVSYVLLSLAEDGLFSCTVPPGPTEEAKDLLELPDDWEIAVLLPIGYPRSKPRRRAHPTDPAPFLHEDKFRGFSMPTTAEQME